MKAVVVESLSEDIETIKYVHDHPEPKLSKDGDVLVKVEAAGCNFYDILMIKGTYQIKQKVPFILGTEVISNLIFFRKTFLSPHIISVAKHRASVSLLVLWGCLRNEREI